MKAVFISHANVSAKLKTTHGGARRMAGTSIFLPTDEAPAVVQRLTHSEIAAIPRDRFSVKVYRSFGVREVVGPSQIKTRTGTRKRNFRAAHYREMRFKTLIELIEKSKEVANDLEKDYNSNNNDDDPTPPSGIFKPVIDEDGMAACILEAKRAFMGSDKTVTLCGHRCDITDFCIIVFCVLAKTNFLASTAQSKFCEYLKDKVLYDKAPKARTFNNHFNNKYSDFISKTAQYNIDTTKAPEQRFRGNFVYMACYNIMKTFQNTEYFGNLRKQRDELASLTL